MDVESIDNKSKFAFTLLQDCINELKYGKNMTYLLNERYNFINTENWNQKGLEEMGWYEKTLLMDLIIKDVSKKEGIVYSEPLFVVH